MTTTPTPPPEPVSPVDRSLFPPPEGACPTGGATTYVAPETTDEPWASYRKLTHDLAALQAMLEADLDEDHASTSASRLCADLVQQAKTVETAAMVRALEFFKKGAVRDAAARAVQGENVVYTVSQLTRELDLLLEQLQGS